MDQGGLKELRLGLQNVTYFEKAGFLSIDINGFSGWKKSGDP
jgi:hypothetical protein